MDFSAGHFQKGLVLLYVLKIIAFCLKVCYIIYTKQGEFTLGKKTVRPAADPKGNHIGIRLSDGEVEKIKNCIDKTGMTKTGVIRAGIELVYEKITGR